MQKKSKTLVLSPKLGEIRSKFFQPSKVQKPFVKIDTIPEEGSEVSSSLKKYPSVEIAEVKSPSDSREISVNYDLPHIPDYVPPTSCCPCTIM